MCESIKKHHKQTCYYNDISMTSNKSLKRGTFLLEYL